MERLSRDELLAMPASVLLDPTTGQAAAYNSSHRTITTAASAELVTYAQSKGYRDVAYDPKLQDPTGMWRPLPAWATAEVQKRLRLIWVRSGNETNDELRAIPLR